MRIASGTGFWENARLLYQFSNFLFSEGFVHWIASKIMYLIMFSCSGDVLNHFWWFSKFRKFSFLAPPGVIFWCVRSHLSEIIFRLDLNSFFFKTSHKFVLLGEKTCSRKNSHFIFEFCETVDSFPNSGHWAVHTSSP